MSRSFILPACVIAVAVGIGMGALLWVRAAAGQPQRRQLDASQFLALVDSGRVASARIGKDQIRGELKPTGPGPRAEYAVSVPSGDGQQVFVERLNRHGVDFAFDRPGISEMWRATLINFLPLTLAFLVVPVLFAVAVLDCAQREFKDPATKIVWGLAIILGVVIGPILYLIAGRPMGKRGSGPSTGSPGGTAQ